MPTNADTDVLYNRVAADGWAVGNSALRDALGWNEARDEAARNVLVA